MRRTAPHGKFDAEYVMLKFQPYFFSPPGVVQSLGVPLSMLHVLLIISIYWVFELMGRIKSPKESWKYIGYYARKYRWSMGILLYSLFFYFIICVFFVKTETRYYAGVLILPAIAFLISGGFFISATIIQRVVQRSLQILGSLEVRVGANWKKAKEDLLDHVSSFLIYFFVAIFSYVFLKVILNAILFENSSYLSSSVLIKVNESLSVILLIPLYLLLFRVVSVTLTSIYQEIYYIIERPVGLVPYTARRDYIVAIFVMLTRLSIILLIVVSLAKKFRSFELGFVLEPPWSYVLGTSIVLPTAIWLSVIVLGTVFEGEEIEVGSHKGRVISFGFLFTHIETMTGQHVYIPNAELLTRTVTRISSRMPRESGIEGEKGIIVSFSCTLGCEHKRADLQKVFESLFKREDAQLGFKAYLREIRHTIPEEVLGYIFSEESDPFVLIEEFREHGVVYRFNFRVRESLYAPIFRSYFMEEFKEKMNELNKSNALSRLSET